MEDLVESVINYFSSKGIKVISNNSCFEVSGYAGEQEYSFVCSLGDNFPYVMPSIILNKNAKDLLSGRPHRFVENELCTYPRDVVFPNVFRPDRIIIEIIEKAVSIISNDNTDADEASFVDEFKAYWEGHIESNETEYLFVEDLSRCQRLSCYKNIKDVFVAESSDKVIEIAKKSLKYKDDPESIYFALLLPINSLAVALAATTQREWYNVIKEHSNDLAQYSSFLRTNKRNEALIIFTSYSNNGWISCGFKHSLLGDRPSFEKGHTPVPLVLAGLEGDRTIKRVSVRECSQTRLFTRGSIGQLFPLSKVGIIGCGSLGSHLVDALADCGLSQFSLFDYERLSVDNIARHLCGYYYVDMYKTHATQFHLGLKNPNVSCECYQENIHTVLESSIELLNKCDAIFVTTADISIDAHIISSLSQCSLKRPVFIMWLEPYAIAAHVIVLQRPQDIFDELYDGQLIYKYTVLQNSGNYQKRDAGCQASYVPYSALQVDMFICNFLDNLFSTNIFMTKSNYRFCWLGSYGIAQKFNLEINSPYRDLQWNTLYSEIISDV
jgi:molybdopterin/thiamine biosynthesis adenylyltransferase